MLEIIDKLVEEKKLKRDEFILLLKEDEEKAISYLREKAASIRDNNYGKTLFLRALVEISSYCKQNCYYCGLRRDNKNAERYSLSKDQILTAAKNAYENGVRTIVLQGGEDPRLNDEYLEGLIKEILSSYDMRITLSLGERSHDSYLRLYNAGARRYLLRHESITEKHYKMLHPENQELNNRIRCLSDLKEIGYQVGCGFMVGSPYQSLDDIIRDLYFIKDFEPHMVGIGPFIKAKGTPFENCKNGSREMTFKLLSIIRIMNPKVLLPATTALESVKRGSAIEALSYGANVIMPNFTNIEDRRKYSIYDNKANDGLDGGENVRLLIEKAEKAGYSISSSYGDSLIETKI